MPVPAAPRVPELQPVPFSKFKKAGYGIIKKYLLNSKALDFYMTICYSVKKQHIVIQKKKEEE